ncbi:hypothetical protein [Paraburkholderia sp. CNPSo 3281]|uniref:hypothetical protein n=1 Tax=Paraburkholderia sp. CNPSo 3281 TaxID=2940933 RepID=UPI0020B75E5A|nr:hypothetical protein [Paraburkholderia sp. CNPSo 3281]MCP3717758.1 hypothetical protein [Paraburkholderia sp. CNPSo 3281]
MLIEDIEYVIFRHPDLAAVRDFMVDYGLLDRQQGVAAMGSGFPGSLNHHQT